MASVSTGRRNTSSVAGVLSEARAAATRPTAPLMPPTAASGPLASEATAPNKTTLPIIQKKPQSNAQSNTTTSSSLPSARQSEQRTDIQDKHQGPSNASKTVLQGNRAQPSSTTKPSPPASSASNTRSSGQTAPPARRVVLHAVKKETIPGSLSSKISKNPSYMDLSSNEASLSQAPPTDTSASRTSDQSALQNARPTSSSANNQRKGRLGMLPPRKTPPDTHAISSQVNPADSLTSTTTSSTTQGQQGSQMSSFRRPAPPPTNTTSASNSNPRRSTGKSASVSTSSSGKPPQPQPQPQNQQTKEIPYQKEQAQTNEVKSETKRKVKDVKSVSVVNLDIVEENNSQLDFEIRPYCFDIQEYLEPIPEEEDRKILWYCM